MGDFALCICWKCKAVEDVPVEEVRYWLQVHFGHHVWLRECDENGDYVFSKLPGVKAEG